MDIIFIIYVISLFLLLVIYIHDRRSGESTPWYKYVITIIFAPVVLVMIPYMIIRNAMREKEMRKMTEQKKIDEQKRLQMRSQYFQLADEPSASLDPRYIDIAHSLLETTKEKEYRYIMEHLDRVGLPEGRHLFVRLPKHQGKGDVSRLYISDSIYKQERASFFDNIYYVDSQYPDAPPSKCNYDIFAEITVECSTMGAWQIYLLSQLWHRLPYFWHGGYDQRYYVFTKEDLVRVVETPRDPHARALEIDCDAYDVAPRIVDAGQGQYYVSCCYWTEWGGLLRDVRLVSIKNNRVDDVVNVTHVTLHKYNCGWQY